MSSRTDAHALQRRREALLARSAALRVQLRHEVAVFEPPLRLADQGLQAVHWLRAHPEWPLAALGAWVVLGPRRALRWALRGFWLWRGLRRLSLSHEVIAAWTRRH